MITGKRIQLIGCPVGEGAGQPGCAMGSAALRIAKIQNELQELGHEVIDSGDLEALSVEEIDLPGKARNVPTIAGWTRSIFKASCQSLEQGYMPVFMGGDHSLSMGSVAGAAQYAAQVGRPLCVLWLDAHLTSIHQLHHRLATCMECQLPFFVVNPGSMAYYQLNSPKLILKMYLCLVFDQ